jgi:predicted dehydrogenase
MLRLAVVGLTPDLLETIACRVRGATLHPDPGTCAALLCAGTSAVHTSTLEDGMREGKDVWIMADADLTPGLLDHARATVVSPDRYLPSRRLIRQQLDAGKLGEPGLLRLHRWELGDHLLRDLDLALWYFGKRPNLVYAVGTQIHLGFPGGGMALLDHVHTLPAGADYRSLSLIGSTGAAYAHDHVNMQLVFRGGPAQATRTDEGILALAALVQDCIDAVTTRRDNSAQRTAWLDVLAVADAVRESLATKRAIVPKGGEA